MKLLGEVLLLVPLVLVAIGDGILFLLKLLFRAGAKKPRKKPRLPKSARIFPPPTPALERLYWFIAGGIAVTVFVFLPFSTYRFLRQLPSPRLLAAGDRAVTTKIFDRNGILLYEIYDDQNRTPLALADIPQVLKDATIAMEDKDFYRHNGLSLRGMLRATRALVFERDLQGGSTITQQLIKSALLTPEVTLSRKAKEMFLAFWAERLFSKDEILEMYLNQVPYGGTAWGVEAASQMYFGKSARDLTLGEAALLAGLPQAPTRYSPYGSHPELAFGRQKEVLRRMVEDKRISEEEAKEVRTQNTPILPPKTPIRAPHFVMYVKDILEKRYGPRMVAQGGLRVRTTLDANIQETVQNIVQFHIDALSSLRVGNGAALVTRPITGEILAMVGSRDYFDLPRQGNVNVTTTLQQPGSAIKVVTYAAALEAGFTAASILDDSPVTYRIPGSPPYAPVNYDGRFHGLVPLRWALGNSYNVPAVKALATIGLPAMIKKGKLMGIDTWTDEDRYGLSLTLGGGEVTMTDMAEVFGALANGGTRVDLWPILEITDYTGRVLERGRSKKTTAAVSPEVAWILTNILSDNQARLAEFGPSSLLQIPAKTVAVKTGTSNDKRDNWTVGYTPSFAVTVWVGNNDNSPMHPILTSGITGAAPIWHDIMVELLKDKPDEALQKPDSVVSLPCYFGRHEYFVKGTQPPSGRCSPIPTKSISPSPPPSP